MKISPYQTPELRNESDAVIQVGTYGKYTPFANAENTGILDYINNNLEALKNALSGAYVYVANKASLPTSGDATKIYVTQDDGKSYKWTGTEWSLLTARLDGLSAYEVAQSLGFTGTEEEWIMSLGSDTVASATVDDEGYLVLHMKGGGEIRTPLQPIIDCIKYRDTASEQATNASNSATSASNSAKASSASEDNAKTSETNAKASETNAKSSEVASKNWAVSETSPDGATDTDSGTGKTQSSRTWALESKASANSASTSATNASTSASNASKSEVEAKTAQAKAEKARDDANSTLAKLTSVMMYTGQVDNYSDLDSITKSKGDVWNIVNADEAHGIKAGDNVVWNGASWDNLSGVVDLSAYAEKADYQKVITSATANGDTITFNHKDGTISTATVNNINHATTATNDANGNNIADTYETKVDATNTYNSITSYTNRLQRNKAYSVGDIAYSPNLPSWAYLECVTAGTTGDTEPNFSTVVSTPPTNMKIGDRITDGDVTFIVRSKGGVVQSVNSVHPDDTGNISIWDSLHRYPRNYVPSDTSNRGWNSLGFCIIYYDEMVINKQPGRYGQLINIPANKDYESTQLWVEQPKGTIYSRGGNMSVVLNDTSFTCAGIGENGHLMFPNGAELWVY